MRILQGYHGTSESCDSGSGFTINPIQASMDMKMCGDRFESCKPSCYRPKQPHTSHLLYTQVRVVNVRQIEQLAPLHRIATLTGHIPYSATHCSIIAVATFQCIVDDATE